MDYIKRILRKISGHFLLRNLILAICGVIIFVYLISLLLNLFTRHGQKYVVPSMVGLTIDQAQPLTSPADLELVVIDSLFVAGMAPGTILDQSPEAEAAVKSGRKVFLVINSISPRSEIIPYVTGFSLRQAKNILQSKGFVIKRLIYKPDMATNNVLSQNYNGTEIVRGSTLKATLGEGITLVVGMNGSAPLPLTPKVVGLSLREAKSRLWEVGLNVGEIRRDADVTELNLDDAKVYKQVPSQQSRLDFGATVALYMSLSDSKVNDNSRKSDKDARQVVDENADISPEELAKMLAD